MSFKKMESTLNKNASMEKKPESRIKQKSITRSYRIDIDIVEALLDTDMNVTQFINKALRVELESRGVLG